MCLLAYAGFFLISELLSIRRCSIVMADLTHKIFIEVIKSDEYRELNMSLYLTSQIFISSSDSLVFTRFHFQILWHNKKS